MNVILVHGLYMNAWVMQPLGWRLKQAGFTPLYFDYASTRLPLRAQAVRLARFIREHDALPCHFVAHSLGGLLLRHLAAGYPQLFQGRAVTLGSPHQGSQAARFLHDYAPFMLGESWAHGLDGALPQKVLPVPCGNIRGSKSMGAGRLMGVCAKSDGTVALAETWLPESALLTLPCTHTGLLLDKTVAAQTVCFLETGRFAE
ncbi:esterase/lipase family protein [Neisseriaceae bacterium B1]